MTVRRLKEYLILSGKTSTALAKDIGVPRQNIDYWVSTNKAWCDFDGRSDEVRKITLEHIVYEG